MTNSTLASFTVNKENWEAFKKLASQEGRSASNCLNQLIEQALYKNAIDVIGSGDKGYITQPDFIDRTEFDQELNDLKSQLEDLRQKIGNASEPQIASVAPKVIDKGNQPKFRNEDGRRQEILELMGYIPTCPQCGSESLSKEGHGKGKDSQRFRCINSACSRKTFTVYPK